MKTETQHQTALRHFVLAAGALLLLVTAPFATAQDTDPVTFTLVNDTGYTIVEFYAAPPSSSRWEEDILGADVLYSGETIEITIDDSREDCNYDFLAVFEDESELEHLEISVCDGEEYIYR